jgi:hypothetical protein
MAQGNPSADPSNEVGLNQGSRQDDGVGNNPDLRAQDRHPTSKTVDLLMKARSTLRQANCPECGKQGYCVNESCQWCLERNALNYQLLSHEPVPETKTTHERNNEFLREQLSPDKHGNIPLYSSAIEPSVEWPREQYQKIQDFVIQRGLFRGSPSDKSHADIVLELAEKAIRAVKANGSDMGFPISEQNQPVIASEKTSGFQPIEKAIAELPPERQAKIDAIREDRCEHRIPRQFCTAVHDDVTVLPHLDTCALKYGGAECSCGADPRNECQPGPIQPEPMDYVVQCRCGWKGKVSELKPLPGFKCGCPDCSTEFVPLDRMTFPVSEDER